MSKLQSVLDKKDLMQLGAPHFHAVLESMRMSGLMPPSNLPETMLTISVLLMLTQDRSPLGLVNRLPIRRTLEWARPEGSR